MSNHRFQEWRVGNLSCDKPTCAKCGNKHIGECLVWIENCFSCGKGWNKARDCPMIKDIGNEGNQVEASGPSYDSPMLNNFYALISRGDQDYSPDVIIGILVFSINVYYLLDVGDNLSFVTPLVSKKFYVLSMFSLNLFG